MEETSASQLERLLNLAEEVSGKVDVLHQNIASLRGQFYLHAIVAYFLSIFIASLFYRRDWFKIFSDELFFILIFSMFALLILNVYYFSKTISRLRLFRGELSLEKEILHRLLDIVHEYLDNLYQIQMNHVDKAILELRLQRIKYSSTR